MKPRGKVCVTREAVLRALGVRDDLVCINFHYDPSTLTFVVTLQGSGLPATPEGNCIMTVPLDRCQPQSLQMKADKLENQLHDLGIKA